MSGNSTLWDDFASRAVEYQCNRMVYTALMITRMTVGCQFPEEVLNNSQINPLRSKIIHILSKRMSFCSLFSFYSGRNLFGRVISPSLLLPYASYSWIQIWQNVGVIYRMNRKMHG